MATFAILKQYPEFWVRQCGSVTARQTMIRYGLKDEDAAVHMLDALVRNRGLMKWTDEAGIVHWFATDR